MQNLMDTVNTNTVTATPFHETRGVSLLIKLLTIDAIENRIL